MDDVGRTASPTCYGWPAELAPVIGAAVAVTVAALYGRPLHAMVTFWLMAFATGLGISLGFHRLSRTAHSPPIDQSSAAL